MTSFNRSATWITPEFAAEFAPEGRTAFFSERQKQTWSDDPQSFLKYRKKVESTMNKFFDLQFKDSDLQRDSFENFGKTMRERLGDKDGLAGWFKIAGQVGLGLIIGLTLFFNDNTFCHKRVINVNHYSECLSNTS